MQGFRKVVPERWEFANDFFRKGEKHLLCEVHRRKTASSSSLPFPPSSPPLFPLYHQPHLDEHLVGASHWRVDLPSPRLLVLGDITAPPMGRSGGAATAAELLEENNMLRRSNSALLSELAHMRQLYNDIIYFLQNHVRPVSPSSVAAASASILLSSAAAYNQRRAGSTTSSSSLTIVEDPSPVEHYHIGSSKCNRGSSSARPKLFGVSLDGCSSSSGKRGLQAQEPTCPSTKPRLAPQKLDLDFSLLPPSLC